MTFAEVLQAGFVVACASGCLLIALAFVVLFYYVRKAEYFDHS
jgi:hypothetical protein